MRRKAYRPRKPRKPRAAKAATLKRPSLKASPFRAHKGRPVGKTFRAHKPLRHVAVFKAHGKRRIAGHGAVARKLKAVKVRRAKALRMRLPVAAWRKAGRAG